MKQIKIPRQIKFHKKMSFQLWIWFSFFSLGLSLLFWALLMTSIKMNYEDGIVSDLNNVAWSICEKYGEDDFENNIRFITESDDYFVQIISEDDDTILTSIDNQGDDAEIQQDNIIKSDLFSELDDTDGYLTYYVADTVHNSKWVVQALVLANYDGYREVLIISKSMADIDSLITLLSSRILIVVFILLIISVFVSWILAQSFTKPIGSLTKKASLLAQGDYKVTFPDTGSYEVKQLSETLEIATQEFNATEKLRRDFIANISHDMKTPLTVIKVYAEMIKTVSRDNPEKRDAQLDTIMNEVDKLTLFINDSMKLARLQSKTESYSFEIIDLNDLIYQLLEEIDIYRETQGYSFITNLCETASIYADNKLLYRAISNIVNNAIKFSKENKTIIINTKQINNKILFEVQDFGKGIKKEDLKYVWERFYQIEENMENRTGMGIGLNIVKEILELHKAEFGVTSEFGEGSCFWFTLEEINEIEKN